MGIRRRLAPLLDGDPREIELAIALLFALPGTPIFYYGDEIGMGDNIWLDDRDGVRTPMQWNAGLNAGFSLAPPEKLYSPVIADGPYAYQRVNLEAQQQDPNSLWNHLRQLAAIRKAHPAFGWGSTTFLSSANPASFGVVRQHGSEVIVAVHNLAPKPQRIEIDWAEVPVPKGQAYNELAAAGLRLDPAPDRLALQLEGFGYAWLLWQVAS